jgi:hypothetical protein
MLAPSDAIWLSYSGIIKEAIKKPGRFVFWENRPHKGHSLDWRI